MDGDDATLVSRLRAGDEAAFMALVDRYHAPLLRLATSFVPSRAIAEEVVQDTWLAVVRGIDGFEGRSSLRTWLFRILVNRARTTGVREQRAGTPSNPVDPDRFDARGAWSEPPVPWADAADDRLTAETIAAHVRIHLDELPESQRQVVVLRDVDGLTSAEVCGLLGVTDGNQRVLLHRGRTRLRTLLEKELA